MADQLTPAAFEPHVGSTFTAVDAGLDLTLVAVRRAAPQPHAPRVHPFALDLEGPAGAVLGQQIHRLVHDRMGVLELFLVPQPPGPAGLPRYEAVFS